MGLIEKGPEVVALDTLPVAAKEPLPLGRETTKALKVHCAGRKLKVPEKAVAGTWRMTERLLMNVAVAENVLIWKKAKLTVVPVKLKVPD